MTNLQRVLFASCLVLSLCFQDSFAQSDKTRKIDEFIKPFATSSQFSGVVLASEDGKVIYEKAFGPTVSPKLSWMDDTANAQKHRFWARPRSAAAAAPTDTVPILKSRAIRSMGLSFFQTRRAHSILFPRV